MAKTRSKNEKFIYAMYALVFILIIAYIFDNNIAIGAAAFVAIAVTIALEFKESISSEGVKKTAMDVGIALIAVVLLVWLLPSLVLQSQSPANVVASCSMLPALHRGDLVLVHGINNVTSFLSQEHVPVINISTSTYDLLFKNLSSEAVEPFPYLNHNVSKILISQYFNASQYPGYQIGFYKVSCLEFYLSYQEYSPISKCFVNESDQGSSMIRYNYTLRQMTEGSATYSIPVTSSISIGNTTIAENFSNPILVYRTVAGDSFTDSQIVHRLFFALNVNGSYYLLTKGDNNPVLDIQALNYPATSNDVVGYVIATVPYLGYPSLILKGQLAPVAQCNQTIINN